MDKRKIEEVLREFSENINRNIVTVIENGEERPATTQDKIDFIGACWEEAEESLSELGIEI